MKQQVLVDMDGVLADVYSQFIQYEFAQTGVKPMQESLYGKLESEAFYHYNKSVRSIGFFRTAPTMPNSIEGLKYLNDKYKVLIVSSATEFPNSLIEKVQWLNEFYPFISWTQMIFCGKKDSVMGDVMLDDHPKNLSLFAGRKLLFSQPHNKFISNKEYERVDNWKQVSSIL